jgi:threonine dehydratase
LEVWSIEPLNAIPFGEILTTQKRITDAIVRTPLIRLNVADTPAEIFLKLEILQPISSFKRLGAGNARLLIELNPKGIDPILRQRYLI